MDTTKTQIQTIVQTRHTDSVLSVAISPDGRYLASGSGEAVVKLWDVQSGNLIRNFVGHSSWIQSVAFSQDGKYLLTGAWDGSAKLWEVLTGACLQTYAGDDANAVCFTPDNKIITVGQAGVVYVWDLHSNYTNHGFQAHTAGILCVALSKNGKYLATGSKDGTAKLWDWETRKVLATYTHSTKAFIHSVVFDPAEKPTYLITAASAEGHEVYPKVSGIPQTLNRWDITDLNSVPAPDVFSGHTDNIYSAAISPDGRYLASGGQDRTICLWDLQDKAAARPIFRFEGHHNDGVVAVCFSPADGNYLANGSYDRAVKLWDIAQKKEVRTFGGLVGNVYAAAMSPNGKYLVGVGEGNKTYVWNLSRGLLVDVLNKEQAEKAPGRKIRAIDISPDSRLFAAGSFDGHIEIWELEGKKQIGTYHIDDRVSSVRFSADGKYLAAGGLGSVICWELGKDEPVLIVQEYSEWGTNVDINAEKGYLVAAFAHDDPDKPDLVLIDLKNNNKRYNLSYTFDRQYPRQMVCGVRMSKDGRYLASAHYDGKVRLWDLENLDAISCIREFIEPHAWVRSVDISADGRYILSGNTDHNARLWDRQSHSDDPVHLFSGHTSKVVARFSPDEKYVITTSWDATTRIWDRQSGKEIATLISIGEADWVVLTPSGLFDASPGGMKKMHYVSGMEVLELDQLKGRYWQPGLLSILLNFRAGKVSETDVLTQLALYPEITSLELRGSLLEVKLVKRGGGIGRTSLRINNKEREQDINKARATEFTIDISKYEKYFAAGENTISIRCWNEEDWLPGPLYEVKYHQKTNVGGDAAPSLYAIFVGTSKYKNDRFSLAFPDQDANYLSNAVKIVGEQYFKSGEVHIRLLTTEQASTPAFSNKTNIKAVFDEFAQLAKPRDIVVFFFTGHGANYDSGKKSLYYYLTHDIVSDDLSDEALRKRTAISSEELCAWINRIPATKQVLILDTCYSGKVLDTLKSKNAVDATREREMERMKDRTGMYILTGSAADKVSYESSSYGQGLLTYTLLMGMRGAALLKNTNQEIPSVDVMNLFSWSREEVERLSKEFGVLQTPTLRTPDNVASFAIGLVPSDVQGKIKVAMPKPVFARSNFMDTEDFMDALNISETLDQYLMGSIGIGNRPQAIFIDVAHFPGAHQVRGLYTKTANGYALKGKVYKDKELKGSFEMEGRGMEDIVPKIAREVEKFAFPMDEYAVPADDEIGVLEKGLIDDLKAIKGQAGFYGYNENFLGQHNVPMPQLHADHLKDIAHLIDPDTKAATAEKELKYQYYSTVQCKSRKFPYFAACNLHGAAFKSAGRHGVFIRDPRLPKEDQCGDELYTYPYKGAAYTTFCHRGHMAKREDPQWAEGPVPPAGETEVKKKEREEPLLKIAERGARLTFFFTNAIPQHGHLNGVVWRGLEDYIMNVATNNKTMQGSDLFKINIMTGPVFQDDDPVFPIPKEQGERVQVPTLFWKVVYYQKQDGQLYYIGFLMGQRELLKAEFDRLDGLKAKDTKATGATTALPPFQGYKEKEVFQVNVSFIEQLTKLKFHPATDPYNDNKPAKEIIEKVQLAKKDIAGGAEGLGYSLEGLSI